MVFDVGWLSQLPTRYTSRAGREWLATNERWHCGLAPLLRVFLVDLPVNVRVFAAFAVSNISIDGDNMVQVEVRCVPHCWHDYAMWRRPTHDVIVLLVRSVLFCSVMFCSVLFCSVLFLVCCVDRRSLRRGCGQARALRAFEVLVPFLAEVQPVDPHEDSSDLQEARSIVYSLISQLSERHPANLTHLAGVRGLVATVLPHDCGRCCIIPEAMNLALGMAESRGAMEAVAVAGDGEGVGDTSPAPSSPLLELVTMIAGLGARRGSDAVSHDQLRVIIARAAQCLADQSGETGRGVPLTQPLPQHK